MTLEALKTFDDSSMHFCTKHISVKKSLIYFGLNSSFSLCTHEVPLSLCTLEVVKQLYAWQGSQHKSIYNQITYLVQTL